MKILTPQQRSEAARKASATRAANKANGVAPKSGKAKMRGGPAFATPKPDYRSLRLVMLAAVEDLFKSKLTERGAVVTQEHRDAFEKYKKIKALALGPTSTETARIEADSALRMAIVKLVSLT